MTTIGEEKFDHQPFSLIFCFLPSSSASQKSKRKYNIISDCTCMLEITRICLATPKRPKEITFNTQLWDTTHLRRANLNIDDEIKEPY